MQQLLVIDDGLAIPRAELRFSFVRSSGPGGQNVNKVNSKAVLHWNVRESPSLPEGVRSRLTRQHGRRINERGELVLSGDRHREQGRNVADCLDRLRHMVAAAARPPKRRIKTKSPRRANEARLRRKSANAQKKAGRRPPTETE